MNRILESIENKKMGVLEWVFGFTSIILIRYFFESISSTTNAGVIPSDTFTIFHTWFFFITTIFGLVVIVGMFTKNHKNLLKLSLFGLPIVWLGPLLDIVFGHGKAYKIAYLQESGSQIITNFITFFGPNFTQGATYGLRIEMAIIIIGIGFYVWHKNKNLYKAFCASLLSYLFIFILFSIPGIIFSLSHISSPTGTVEAVIKNEFQNIIYSNIGHNTFRDGLSYVSLSRLVEMGFDKMLSQIYFVLSVLFLGLIFWKTDKKSFVLTKKNSRPERVVFFNILVLLGGFLAYIYSKGTLSSWVDILTTICLLLSWSFAWVFSVQINDLADVDIDKISNKDRPLVSGEISQEKVKNISYILLFASIVGAWATGFFCFYMVLVYLGASYIYSSEPFRFRKMAILSSFLIGIVCLISVLNGFFFVSLDKKMQSFPTTLAVGIITIFTLIISFKDLKDVEGDRANGINTLATIFEKRYKLVIGLCFSLGIILVPVFLSLNFLYITSIPTAIAGFVIINSKNYKDSNIFKLGLVYLLSTILLILMLSNLSSI